MYEIGEGRRLQVTVNEKNQVVISTSAQEFTRCIMSKRAWESVVECADDISELLLRNPRKNWEDDILHFHLSGPVCLHACAECSRVQMALLPEIEGNVINIQYPPSLSLTEWTKLRAIMGSISRSLPREEVAEQPPLMYEDEHGRLQCSVCENKFECW